MAIRKLALMLPVAALLVACQSGESRAGREQELEQRVQTLERQLLEAQMASPSPQAPAANLEDTAWQPAGPASAAARPAPAAPRTAPAPVVRSQPARTASSASGTSTSGRRTASRRGDVRSQPEDVEPFDDGPSAGESGDNGDDDRSAAVQPRATTMVLPEGTELHLVLEEALSSATSRAGEPVTARVERAVSEDGRIVLPGGTVLQGRVTDVRSSGRVSGRARIAIDFDRIVVRGRTHELAASAIVAEAPSQAGRDAKIVGGSAAAGAILGAIADGKKGAVRGAVVGAGAGGAAVLITKGKEIEMPAGSRWTVRVTSSVRL